MRNMCFSLLKMHCVLLLAVRRLEKVIAKRQKGGQKMLQPSEIQHFLIN